MKTPIPRHSWGFNCRSGRIRTCAFQDTEFLAPYLWATLRWASDISSNAQSMIRVIVVARDCVDKGENYDDSNPIEPICIISWRVVTFCDMFQKKEQGYCPALFSYPLICAILRIASFMYLHKCLSV